MDTSQMHYQRPQSPQILPIASQFELRFQSLFHAGKALAFPCDSHGDVLLDALSSRALENYLFARAVVGHEYANPVIQPCEASLR